MPKGLQDTMEIKDYQDEPNTLLFYKIVELSKESLLEFGESELSEFLLGVAQDYKSKNFEFTRKLVKAKLDEYTKLMESKEELDNNQNLQELFSTLKVN